MKKLLSFLAIIGFAAVFAGCTTGPSYHAAQNTFPPLAADAGRIFIYRDAILSPDKEPVILLNGEQAGVSKAQGFFYVDRPAGDYEVKIDGETPPASFILVKGQTIYVRIDLHSGLLASHLHPKVVDADTAQHEIVSCKYTGDAQK